MEESNPAEFIDPSFEKSFNKNSSYNWRIIHPFDNDSTLGVEVMPWKGLIPRWRFVLPSEYNGLIKWGIIIPGTYNVDENVLRPIENGPTQLIDGPNVIWFGGHKPLSINLAAIIILKVPPPHYIAFGSSENQNDPPKSLEIISFDDDKLHPPHK